MAGSNRTREHLEHAAHNERFFEFLLRHLEQHPEFADWAIVVMFYAALHYTKGAILRDHGAFSRRHRSYREPHGGMLRDGHNDLVNLHLPDVFTSYMELFQQSQDVRYRPYFRSPRLGDELQLLRAHLRLIKEACRPEVAS